MQVQAFYITKLFKSKEPIFEVIGGAETDISVEEKLFLKALKGTSIFVVKDIEAFRKKIKTLPRGYSGLITLELIGGNSPDFIERDYLFKE